MGTTELGRVIDKQALADDEGARGVLRVNVPPSWVRKGSRITVALPARFECARCSGGGCDGCERSGALRAPPEPSARSMELIIPPGSADGVAIRVAQPFGEAASIVQIIIEIRCAEAPSPCVSRIRERRFRHRRGAPDDDALSTPRAALKGRSAIAVASAIVIATIAAAVSLIASRG